MAYEAEGVMHHIFDTEQKSASFQTREFVIEIPDGTYPQMVKFQLVQDRVTLIDGCQKGERVRVHFDLRGREWQGKYFTTLNAWRIEKMDQAQSAAPAAQQSAPPAVTSFPSAQDEPMAADDLPF